jgi:hypothetical protein
MPIVAPQELIAEARQLYPVVFDEVAFQGRLAESYTAVKARSSSGNPASPGFALSKEDAAVKPRYIVSISMTPDEMAQNGKLLSLVAYRVETKTSMNFDLPFLDKNDIMEKMAFFVWNFSANISRDEPPPPVVIVEASVPPEDYAWKNKRLYLGLQGIAAPGIYTAEALDRQAVGLGYGGGARAEFQFVHWYWPQNYLSLSVALGADLLIETFSYQVAHLDATGDGENGVSSDTLVFDPRSLFIPAVFNLNYNPGHVTQSFYAGAYYVLPLLDSCTVDLPLGVTVGWKGGMKAGTRGILFLNVRYSQDLGQTDIQASGRAVRFRRSSLFVGIGYEVGLFNRKVQDAPDTEAPDTASETGTGDSTKK